MTSSTRTASTNGKTVKVKSMSEQKAFLEKVHIKNFLSLRNVTLPFKPLTVLVGPNASGKSNVLSALKCLKDMMVSEIPPQIRFIQKLLWVGEARDITFRLHTEIDKFSTEYFQQKLVTLLLSKDY